jgi:hypothetical protein
MLAAFGSAFWSPSSSSYVVDLASVEQRSQVFHFVPPNFHFCGKANLKIIREALALLRSCGDLGIVIGSGKFYIFIYV